MLDRLAIMGGLAAGGALATVNALVIGLADGELAAGHDMIVRHLRFYIRVWSATGGWFTVAIFAELIGSLTLITFAVGRLDRRARRDLPGASTPSATGHPPEVNR